MIPRKPIDEVDLDRYSLALMTGIKLNHDQDTDVQAMNVVSYNNRCNEEKGSTMAHIVKKSELKMIDGYLTVGGTLIAPAFIKQYIALEELLQHFEYSKMIAKMNNLPAFKMKSTRKTTLIPVPTPKTPVMDAKAAEVDLVSEESKLMGKAADVEEILAVHNSVVEFIVGDTVVLTDDDYHATIIDTPTLGNPLKLTKEELLKIVCDAVGYDID